MGTQTSIIARTAEEIRTYTHAVRVAEKRGYITNPQRLLGRLNEKRDRLDHLENLRRATARTTPARSGLTS